MKKYFKTIIGRTNLVSISISLLLLISVLLLSSYAQSNIQAQQKIRTRSNLEHDAGIINASITMLGDSLWYLTYDHDGMKRLEQAENGMPMDEAEYWIAINELLRFTHSVETVYDYVETIFIYYPNQGLFLNSEVNSEMRDYIKEETASGKAVGTAWRIVPTSKGWYLCKMAYLRKGYMGCWFSCRNLMNAFFSDKNSDFNDQLYLTDSSGHLLFGTDENRSADAEAAEISSRGSEAAAWIDPIHLTHTASDEQNFMTISIDSCGLWLVTDYLKSQEGLTIFRNGYIVLILLMLVLAIVVTVITNIRWLRRPIRTMIRDIERIGSGELDYRMNPPKGTAAEFLEISARFNEMLDQLQQTKIRMYEQEIDRSRTKQRYLSQQIRPHFMLNALNTIYGFCRKDPDTARKIIRLLSSYYSYVVKVEADYVPMKEELDHIRNYLDFQKVRLEDMLTYDIICAPALEVVPIPPFLIESFVGNSLKYGAGEDDVIRIHIQVISTGDFSIRVIIRDEGSGYSEEVLDAVRTFCADGTVDKALGTGIHNSIERLKLIYQEQASAKLYNDHGAVTQIDIRLQPAEHKD